MPRVERISVVIPCRDTEAWVADCLESVAGQTRPADEVIVVDDGSVDGTLEQVLQHRLPHRLVRTEQVGAAGARNAGVALATGDWIAFLDSDDIWYEQHLERLCAVIDESDAVAMLNQFDHLDAGTGAIRTRAPFFPEARARNDLTSIDFFRWLGKHARLVGMSALCVCRRAFHEVGGLDASMVRRHDIEFWLRVMPGRTWAWDPAASSAYRSNRPGSLSRHSVNAAYCMLRALSRHQAAYPADQIQPMLRQSARSALSSALTDGSVEDADRAWSLAAHHLGPWERALFGTARRARPVFAAANRLRRSLTEYERGQAGKTSRSGVAGADGVQVRRLLG